MIKPAHLPWLIAAIAGLAVLMPRTADMGNTEDKSIQTETSSAGSQSSSWYAGETVLDRQPDGHFYVDASVDGIAIHFMVDTGASVVALTGEDAYNLGIDWNEDQIGSIGYGASGAVRGVSMVINEMELGEFRNNNVQAVIIPEGLQISLLGQSFLSEIRNVKITGDQMILSAED